MKITITPNNPEYTVVNQIRPTSYDEGVNQILREIRQMLYDNVDGSLARVDELLGEFTVKTEVEE